MSNAAQDDSKKGAFEVRATASDWLVARHMSADWSEADQQRLDSWLSQAPENAIAFWRLEGAWMQARRLNALRQPMRQSSQKSLPIFPLRLFPMVAALLLVAVVGVGVIAFRRAGDEGQTYATPIGGHLAIAMSDGSRIELNTNTVLHLYVAEGQRKAVLDRGEAYFQIRHDAANPFSVTAGAHRIVDLGTKFVVRDRPGRLEVSLIEGRAEIASATASAPSQAAILSPGDFAVATARTLTVSKEQSAKVEDRLSWRRGLLTFKYTTLAAAADEFNRYNDTKIVIADPQVARLAIHGIFPTTDVSGFADAAQAYFKLHVENRGNEVVISR